MLKEKFTTQDILFNQADNDADVLIIETAINQFNLTHVNVVVVRATSDQQPVSSIQYPVSSVKNLRGKSVLLRTPSSIHQIIQNSSSQSSKPNSSFESSEFVVYTEQLFSELKTNSSSKNYEFHRLHRANAAF
ncbi:hypothetical protein PV328_012150, partial [Microctonus aethiopoides]